MIVFVRFFSTCFSISIYVTFICLIYSLRLPTRLGICRASPLLHYQNGQHGNMNDVAPTAEILHHGDECGVKVTAHNADNKPNSQIVYSLDHHSKSFRLMFIANLVVKLCQYCKDREGISCIFVNFLFLI